MQATSIALMATLMSFVLAMTYLTIDIILDNDWAMLMSRVFLTVTSIGSIVTVVAYFAEIAILEGKVI